MRVLNVFVKPCQAIRFDNFEVIIQSLVNFAVGYRDTNLSKRGKNFTQDFFFFNYFAQR